MDTICITRCGQLARFPLLSSDCNFNIMELHSLRFLIAPVTSWWSYSLGLAHSHRKPSKLNLPHTSLRCSLPFQHHASIQVKAHSALACNPPPAADTGSSESSSAPLQHQHEASHMHLSCLLHQPCSFQVCRRLQSSTAAPFFCVCFGQTKPKAFPDRSG